MRHAYSEAGRWVVDVDGNTTDGSLIVTIRSPDLYLDFRCPSEGKLRTAAEFLRSPYSGDSLKLGTFCGTLSVELDWFSTESEEIYLSVTRADDQSMAYCLKSDDRSLLAQALLQVADALALG